LTDFFARYGYLVIFFGVLLEDVACRRRASVVAGVMAIIVSSVPVEHRDGLRLRMACTRLSDIRAVSASEAR
jgi:hypothetical protein